MEISRQTASHDFLRPRFNRQENDSVRTVLLSNSREGLLDLRYIMSHLIRTYADRLYWLCVGFVSHQSWNLHIVSRRRISGYWCLYIMPFRMRNLQRIPKLPGNEPHKEAVDFGFQSSLFLANAGEMFSSVELHKFPWNLKIFIFTCIHISPELYA